MVVVWGRGVLSALSMKSISSEELAGENRAMRAAHCEDIENFNRFREEEDSGALRLPSRERPKVVQAELLLGRARS